MSDTPQLRRLVFVNRYYWPEEPATAQLLTDLAEGLAVAGRPVTVITSRPRGPGAPPARETRRGVGILRVGATRAGRGLFAKALDYLTFSLAARRALAAQLGPGDRVIAMTDPPLLATIVAARARGAGASVIHWLQDVHPEIGISLSGSRLLAAACAPWIRRRDAAWRQAQACVAVSNDMAAFVVTRGVPSDRVRAIHNWALGGDRLDPVEPGKDPLVESWQLRGRIVVAYSGNLGRVHALEPVIAAAAALRGDPSLVFLFVGDGPQRPALEAAARAAGLASVRFLPPQPRDRLAASLSAADIHLVTLRPGCERLVFPSKLYGIAAVGRPVVYVGPVDCEIAAIVRESGLGVTVPPDATDTLAAAIRDLAADAPRRRRMGEAALAWSRRAGGLPAALAAWRELLA